jgi:hypothetical protein
MKLSEEHELTYNSWRAMVARCCNEKSPSWEWYGKRGIQVCQRWRRFAAFLADMGDRPSVSHTIERIDNDSNYEPSNCRWATRSEQCKNFRPIGRYAGIVADGVRRSARDWEKDSPVSRHSIANRIRKGMAAEEAIAKPPTHYRRFDESDKREMRSSFDAGVSVAAIARQLNADPSTVWRIVHQKESDHARVRQSAT